MIDSQLLEILVCPACKGAVEARGEWIVCMNRDCALKFPIRDGIPVMLIEEGQR